MKRIAIASLLFAALGCGEPKAPPPGAPTEKMETPTIDVPTDSPAPTEDKGPELVVGSSMKFDKLGPLVVNSDGVSVALS